MEFAIIWQHGLPIPTRIPQLCSVIKVGFGSSYDDFGIDCTRPSQEFTLRVPKVSVVQFLLFSTNGQLLDFGELGET